MKRRDFLAGMVGSAVVGSEMLGSVLLAGCRPRARGTVVGSKNFTEQLLLGELLAQYLEPVAPRGIDRRFYLAGTYICHQALLAGRIDMYVEYTGTALAAVLKEKPVSDHSQVFEIVRREYATRFGLEVLPSLGFDNSFAMVMRGADARQMGVSRLSQLAPFAPRLRMGVGFEFLERPDGYKGLVKKYGLEFGEAPRVMDLGLLYRALQSRQVDIVAGSNTDGLIAALDLVVLDDDAQYFPPYDAVVIARPDCLRQTPPIAAALAGLAGRIHAADMRRMNYSVDGEKQDSTIVVRRFLHETNLAAVQQSRLYACPFVP